MAINHNNIVFFFGAGASAVEGAPIASKLLTEAFKELPNDGRIHKVKEFLEDFYRNDFSDDTFIPTFEEILSPIDISLQKQEQFSDKWDYKKLSELRDDLIYCICSILHEKLWSRNTHHKNLITQIFNHHPDYYRFSFMSLNYDILLDNALLLLADRSGGNYVDIDYGIEFRNEGDDWKSPRERKVFLFKLHGSLNWLFCPTCNSIKITPKEKGVMRIFTHSEVCEKDRSNQKALIIPPTWQKIYENPYLVSIWLKAEQILQKASKVFFIGYSMPDSDVHIKYLLKKSLYRSRGQQPNIIVVDRNGKDVSSPEYYRYKRLFGSIDYQPIGFENFATRVNDFISNSHSK